MFEFAKLCLKKLKLFVLFWRRIVFVRNNFKCSIFKKLKANICGGYLADQWMLYDFDHNDKHEYLSEFDWYRSRYINEPFDFLLNNKIAATEILKQYVRVPEIFAIKNKGILSTFEKEVIDYKDVIEILKREKSLFIKPYGAGKGTGVNRLKHLEDAFYIDDKEVDESNIMDVLADRDNWILCETIVQHSYADHIYDKTVNTMRIITLRDISTNEFKVFFAVQRIGTSETIPVDNGSRGGLVANIDIDTGVLSEARCLHNRNVYENHPDSGAAIKNTKVPEWNKIKSDVLELARRMPYMYFIAWDIVLTKEGIAVIEANTSSGVNIIQLWGGQRNDELGDFYRHHKVIK